MPTGRFSNKVFPGAVFEFWEVLERIPDSDGMVRCRCICGTEKKIKAASLVSHRSKSCGCRRRTIGKRGRIIAGNVFGRLMVIEQVGTERAECRCDCGNKTTPLVDDLIYGLTKSCGCLAKETTGTRNKQNAKFKGMSVDPRWRLTYKTWRSLRHRMINDLRYSGVEICKHLWKSPWGLAQLLGPRPTKDHTLDRYPNHDGNYTCGYCKDCENNTWKKNVRWATRKEQANNRGGFNILLTAFDKTLTRSQWQDVSGIDEWRIHRRINELGWSIEKALTTPDRNGRCYRP